MPRRGKLVPALYNLFLDGKLNVPFTVLGVDRVALGEDEYRRQLQAGVDAFSRRGETAEEWAAFAHRLHYLQADLLGGRG